MSVPTLKTEHASRRRKPTPRRAPSAVPIPYWRGANYWLRVPRSDRRAVRRSTGTHDLRTAKAIAGMVEQLRARGRQDLLDAACAGRVTLMQLWADYRADSELVTTSDQLNDIDLEPTITRWERSLVAGGRHRKKSVEDMVLMVRRFAPKRIRLPRSQFTRSRIRSFLDGLTQPVDDTRPVSGSTRNRY